MAISSDELTLTNKIPRVFAVCVLPVYSWSILHVLRELPAWILYMTTWDLSGVIAYILAFALFESLLVLLCAIVLAYILPGRFFRKRFVANSTLLILLTSGWAIAAHFNDQAISLWGPRDFLFWFGIYIASIGFFYVMLLRYKPIERAMNALADRLTVLLYLYTPLSILGVIILLVRNL